MNREIKLQVWDGEYLFEVTWAAFKNGKITIVEGYPIDGGAKGTLHEHEIKAIRQYTGLKDKNGKEIYEGDVVRYKVGSSGPYVTEPVSYLTEQTMWVKGFSQNLASYKKTTEVIGNVYENPKLLTKDSPNA